MARDTADAPNPLPDWLLCGEEPHPLGNITGCQVLRNDGISLLTMYSGDIDAEADAATGAYARDTRYLSRLRFSFSGVEPTLLDSRVPDGGLSAILTNPAILVRASGEIIPAQTLLVRRTTLLAGGLFQNLSISNYGQRQVDCELRVEFDADFHDIFEVRGFARKSARPPVIAVTTRNSVEFRFTGADGRARKTDVNFEPAPEVLTTRRASFVLPLEPGATAEIVIRVGVDDTAPTESMEAAAARVAGALSSWHATVTRIETDNVAFNAVLERSLSDIHALQTDWEEKRYLAAGVPWFDTLFGRDSLIAGMQLVAFAPDVLRQALVVLAEYQATASDPQSDALPGKIPHELRWGELAQAGEVPFARYYGSADSTPLFVLAVAEYMRWTNDGQLLDKLWPNVQRAVELLRQQARDGVQGFLSYSRETASGLENQGWKDSHDAIVWPDGRLAEPPIALVEVQGYFAAAMAGFAELAALRGELAESAQAAAESKDHVKRLEQAFGDAEVGLALCLDGAGRKVATPASNAGHVLWAGACSAATASIIEHRLMQPDMFTGWGIRTLSSTVKGYNPLGYHVGSVWPHDNSLIVAGLRRYGCDGAAAQLSDALMAMAISFPEFRVPELFCGDRRELRPVPTPYPVASRPQAWAAATIPYVIVSMLGLRPGLANQLIVARPMLPRGISWLRMRGLRVGIGQVDLVFRLQDQTVSVEIEHLDQGLEVILSRELEQRG